MNELIADIIRGKADGESTADVVALCFLASLVVSTVEAEILGAIDLDEMPPSDERDAGFRHVLERVGKILCPLADDVKHTRPGYVEGMTAARLDYAGISFSDELQSVWSRNIRELAGEGQLSSVEVAVERDVYKVLRVQQGMLGV